MKRTMCTAVLMAVAAVVLLGAGQVSGRPASPGQQYSITDLGALPGGENFTFATAINDRGQVVGQSGTASGESHGFLWENGQMTDLGALPGAVSSIALGINNRGQVVGQSTANFEQFHAFLWQDGKMTNLGTLPGGDSSVAWDINNRGQVVGWSTPPSGGLHAVLWTK